MITRRRLLQTSAAALALLPSMARAALRVAPAPFDATPPTQADVVIIGGGLVGVSTALYLAERGVSVVLCEKGFIGGEQSSRALGWVRVMGRDPRDIPLNMESGRLWQDMNRMVEGETGYRQSGLLYLYGDPAAVAAQESWLARAREFNIDSRILSGDEAAKLVPESSRPFAGGLYTPSDGQADPALAATAIAHGAWKRGAKISTFCAVRGIETQAGRISGVITEKGAIACNAVLIAGGAWSRLFCGNNNIELPSLPVGSFVMRTTPLSGPDICARTATVGLRRTLDGGYYVASPQGLSDITADTFRQFKTFLPVLRSQWRGVDLRIGRGFLNEWHMPKRWALDEISPFEKERVLDPGPAPWADKVWTEATALFPSFNAAVVAEQWGGVIDTTPDLMPVISPLESVPGLFIAAGFSGGGLGAAPGAGKLAADLITGAVPVVDPAPFRYSRFFDGSDLSIAH